MIAKEIGFWGIMTAMGNKLIPWLNEALRDRGWSQRELWRRSGVAQSTISNVLAGERSPTWEFCAKIAGPLGVPLDDLVVLAGLKPAPPPPLANEDRVLSTLRELNASEQRAAIKMLEGLRGQPGHGVNEHPPAYTASPLRPEFDEIAAQLAALPDGPIRNEAMAAIRAIAASAQQRAAASPHHEESHESETRDVAGPGPHLAPG